MKAQRRARLAGIRLAPLVAASVASLVWASPARSVEPTLVGSFRLPGELEVVTSEDHASPTVWVESWVKAGSALDFAGYPGVAAVTARAIAHQAAPAIAAAGGHLETSPMRDAVYFTLSLPAGKLAVGLDALGGALAHPAWSNEDLAAARGPVPSAPDASGTTSLLEALYGPAYGHAPTGQLEAVNALTTADVSSFYGRYYLPATTRVVIRGDFATGFTVGQVVRSYAGFLKRMPAIGPAPMRPLAAARPAIAPPGDARVLLGARGPGYGDEREQAAMGVLASVLRTRLGGIPAFQGRDPSPDVSWGTPDYPTTLVASGGTELAQSAEGERAMREGVADLRTGLISLDELSRAAHQVTRDYGEEVGRPAGLARQLGLAATLAGDYHRALTFPDEVQQVSRQDVMAVAQKYLPVEALKVVVLQPRASE